MKRVLDELYKEIDAIYNKAEVVYGVWASEVAEERSTGTTQQ